MDHDFPVYSFQLTQAIDMAVIKRKLEPHGRIVSFAARGLRFIPDHPAWPPAYFNLDGTFDLATKDLYMDDVLQFVEFLQEVLAVEIQGDV